MNDQRRQAAIEAGAQVLDPKAWDETWANPELRALLRVKAWATAAAVIDAAAPHLAGEPVEWIILNHYGAPAYSGTKDREEALDRARRWNEGRPADSRYRVVALVPVDEP